MIFWVVRVKVIHGEYLLGLHFICYFISNQSFHGNLQYLINHKYIINQNSTNKKSSSGITSKTAIFCDLKFQCRATLSLSVILQS